MCQKYSASVSANAREAAQGQRAPELDEVQQRQVAAEAQGAVDAQRAAELREAPDLAA